MSCNFLHLLACLALLAVSAGAQNRSTFVSLEHSPSSLAYDPVRKLVYAAQPAVNEVYVIEVSSGRVIDRIRIPLALEVALSPSSGVLFVGTRSDFIYAIDTANRRVINRAVVPAAVFGPSSVTRMAVTKSGKVLLGGNGLQLWDPSSGLFKSFPGAYLGDPSDFNGGVTVSASGDGSKVIVSSGFDRAYLYDSDSDSVLIKGGLPNPLPTFINVAANHNGSQFAALGNSQLYFYDGSFTEIHRMNINPSGFVYSRDGRFLYLATYSSYGRVILTLDTSTFQVVAQAPGVALLGAFYNQVSNTFYNEELFASLPMAAGEDGLIFGTGNLGVAIEDTANVSGLDSPAPYIGRIFPAQGSINGGTALTLRGYSFPAPPTSIQFGSPASSTGANLQSSEILTATSPPSAQSGPVNVKANFANGWFALSPNGFTYGPHILYLLTSGGPSTGGTTVKIIGYGFDFSPGQVQVTFGGQAATVVSVSRDAPNTLRHNGFSVQFGQHPYHLIEAISPPGTPGEADVTISTPAGSTTATRAFAYLKTSTVIPYSGELATPTYDWLRGRVYFSDPPSAKVVALDVNTRQFLPISFPAGLVAGRSALTPDGSKLVVANQGEASISIINPDNAQSTKVEVIQNGENSKFFIYGIATTALNKAFVVPLDSLYGIGCRMPLLQVDLSSLQVTQNAFPSCLHEAPHMSSSRDGTKVFMVGRNSSGGPIKAWNAETDSFSERYLASIFEGFRDDVAVSADGNMIVGDLDIIDSDLRLRSRLHPPSSFFYVDPFVFKRGMRLNASGSLAYVPREHGYVDVQNARTGELLRRIKTPAEFYLSPTLGGYDDPPLMTIDDSGRTIYGVAQAGAMIVELADLPLALGSISPAVDVPEGGTVARIRGSGFRPDSIVSFGAQDLTTTFIDENTLQVTTPAHPVGQVSVSTRNPNGDSATMYAEFRYTLAASVPSITSVEPNKITIPGATFVLQGLNFLPESQVLWNGIPLPTQFKGSTELTAYHNGLVAVPLGTSQLTVKNPAPGGGTSAPAAVQVFNPAPSVAIEYPFQAIAGGPSFEIRFRGYEFVPGAKVYWNDIEVPFGGNGTYFASIDASLIAHPGTAILKAVNPPPMLGSGSTAMFPVLAPSPAASVAPVSSVNFFNTLIFGSKTGLVGVYSHGTSVFNLSGVSISGPFAITATTCGASLPPGQNCTYTIEYRPTSLGQHAGEFSVTGNAAVNPMQLAGSALDLTMSLQRPMRPARGQLASTATKEALIPFSLASNSTEASVVQVTCVAEPKRGSCETTSRTYTIGGSNPSRNVTVRWKPWGNRPKRLRSTPIESSPVTLTFHLSGDWGRRSIQMQVNPADYVTQP